MISYDFVISEFPAHYEQLQCSDLFSPLMFVSTLQVIVTDRAGHAYDTLVSLSDIELKALGGVVAVVGQLNSNSICPIVIILSFL